MTAPSPPPQGGGTTHKKKKKMTHIVLDIHLESFALGMLSSLAITLAVFGLKWEIRGHKKRTAQKRVNRKKNEKIG